MANGESSIFCPACRKQTLAPKSSDGVFFSCKLCQAKLRWRVRGSQARLELISNSTTVAERENRRRQTPVNPAGRFTGRRAVYVGSGLAAIVAVAALLISLAPWRRGEPSAGEANASVTIPAAQPPVDEEEVPRSPRGKVEVIAALEPSVCKIITPESSGTGFLVAPNLIATNKHVVGCWDSGSLQAEFLDRSTSLSAGTEAAWVVRNLKFAYAAENYDLCFLRADSIPPSCLPIPPAKMESLARGQEIIIIGCPYGQEGTISPGVLNQLRADIDSQPLISVSAAVNPGNSGGPVITLLGEAAGVVVLKHGLADGLGYAVPASVVTESLRRLTDDSEEEIKKNTSHYMCQQATTAILLSTIEMLKGVTTPSGTAQEEFSVPRTKALLSTALTLIDRAEGAGSRREHTEMLARAVAQAERVLALMQAGSGQGLATEFESLAEMDGQLKSEIGYLEFELP